MSTVFISCTTDPGALQEQNLAAALKSELEAKGISSYLCTTNPATPEAQNEFFSELQSSAALVVVTADAQRASNGWAKAGWSTYLTGISNGTKRPGSILALTDGIAPEALPDMLKNAPAFASAVDAANAVASICPAAAAPVSVPDPNEKTVSSDTIAEQFAPVPMAQNNPPMQGNYPAGVPMQQPQLPSALPYMQQAAASQQIESARQEIYQGAPAPNARKKGGTGMAVLFVILSLIIAGGAAFLIADPFDMNLFGGSSSTAKIPVAVEPEEVNCDYVIYKYVDPEYEDVSYDAYGSDGKYYGSWYSWDDAEYLVECIEDKNYERISTGRYKFKSSNRTLTIDYTAPDSDGGAECEFTGKLSASLTRTDGEYYNNSRLLDGNYESTFYGYVYDGKLYKGDSSVLESFWMD